MSQQALNRSTPMPTKPTSGLRRSLLGPGSFKIWSIGPIACCPDNLHAVANYSVVPYERNGASVCRRGTCLRICGAGVLSRAGQGSDRWDRDQEHSHLCHHCRPHRNHLGAGACVGGQSNEGTFGLVQKRHHYPASDPTCRDWDDVVPHVRLQLRHHHADF